MAEPTPGAPGGGHSGPRSATAATFQVDDSTLRDLRKTFQGLTADVLKFGAALEGLRKGGNTLDSIHAKFSALGMAGTGSAHAAGGAAGRTVTESPTTKVGDGRAPNGGDLKHSGGDSGESGRFSQTQKRVGAFALGTTYQAGAFYKNRTSDIAGLDAMYVQGSMATGAGYSRGRYEEQRRFLTGTGANNNGIGGYQSAQDLAQGFSNVQQTFGNAGSTRGRAALTAAGQLSMLSPTMGLTGSTQVGQNLYNPQVANRMRSLGITPMGSHGKVQTPQEIFRAVQQRVFHGQKITAGMINDGLQPGAPLYIDLVGLGLDANAMEAFRLYAMAQVTLGGSGQRVDRALSDASQGKHTADTRAAGFTSTIASRINEAGGASTRKTSEATSEGRQALMTGYTQLGQATDQLTEKFRTLNRGLGGMAGGGAAYASFLPGSAGGARGLLGSVGQDVFNAHTIRGVLGGVMGGKGGVKGRLMGGLKGGASGELIASGAMGTPVYVTNMPGGGFGGGPGAGEGTKLFDKLKSSKLGKMLGLGGEAGAVAGAEGAAGMSLAAAGSIAAGALAGGGAIVAGFQQHSQNSLNAGMLARGSKQGRRHRGSHWWDTRKFDTWKEQTAHDVFGHIPGLGGAIDRGTGYKYDHDAANPPSYLQSQPGGASRGGGGGKTTSPSPAPTASASSVGSIIGTAESFVGTPYVWGGSNPRTGFDCSGLLQWSFGQHGIKIPRVSQDQQKAGIEVDPKQMVPGDLLFYGRPAEHVAMYTGNGMMVEAPHTGALVRNEPVRTPDGGVRRMVGGGAAFKGSFAPSAASGKQGNSGSGPATSAGGNLRAGPRFGGGGGGFGDEMSALAAVLAPPSLLSTAMSMLNKNPHASAGKGGGEVPKSATGMAASNATPRAPGSISGSVAIARQLASARGWGGGKEWDSLYALWNQESSFKTNAGDPTHAYGIPQALPGSKMAEAGADWMTNPATQVKWGLGYIADRYKDPIQAWAHKAATDSTKGARSALAQPGGWYADGAWNISHDQYAVLHQGEMVVPAAAASKSRSMLAGAAGRQTRQSSGVQGAAGGLRTVEVTVHAPIQMVGRATAQDAREYVGMIKSEMQREMTLEHIGAG